MRQQVNTDVLQVMSIVPGYLHYSPIVSRLLSVSMLGATVYIVCLTFIALGVAENGGGSPPSRAGSEPYRGPFLAWRVRHSVLEGLLS